MKKLVGGFILLSLFAVFEVKIAFSNDAKKNYLTLQNVEALATPEIIIGPFCMVTSSICTIESDGLFLRGVSQF